MQVGVRELRDGLSKHLAEVRAGHTVTVTDHGRPIAQAGALPVKSPVGWSSCGSKARSSPHGGPRRLHRGRSWRTGESAT